MSKIVRDIGNPPYKLEVGSGGNPQPGYLHTDVDQSMPQLDIVFTMGKEIIPIPDNSVYELISFHSLEHCSWLDVGFVVKDWLRVLHPGGRVFIRTPDLEFICRMYLEGKTTQESPLDENNAVRIFGDCGPSEYANIKLFAGQNYGGNFHMLCFDYPLLKRLLERNGFVDVERVHQLPIFSPGEIQCIASKPTATSN